MATQRNRPIENTDFDNPEISNVIDFSSLSTGGVSITPVQSSHREFDTTTQEGLIAYEKFMSEPVTIKVHTTSDKNEPEVADVALHGVRCPIPREKPVRLPRAFLEVLARSYVRVYRQERVPDPDAAEGMKTRRSIGASFPFQILHDPNPKGRAWLQRITHESA